MWSQNVSVGGGEDYLPTPKGTLPTFQKLTSNSSYGSSNARVNQYTALSSYASQSDAWSAMSPYDTTPAYAATPTMLSSRHRMTAPTHLTASESLSLCKCLYSIMLL